MIDVTKIKEILKAHKTNIISNYGITDIAIFGSYGRGQQTNESDVDIMVDFSKPIGIEFIDLADELEMLLGVKVDLVSKKGIKPNYFKQIEAELIYV